MIIIKKHKNRKMYNYTTKQYITLPEIYDLDINKIRFKVLLRENGQDITALTKVKATSSVMITRLKTAIDLQKEQLCALPKKN